MPSKKKRKKPSRKPTSKRVHHQAKASITKGSEIVRVQTRSRQRFQGFVAVQLLVLILLLSLLFQGDELIQDDSLEKEITDEELRQQIQDLVDELYEKDRSLLEGIQTISVTRHDLDFLETGEEPVCEPGDILGAFGQDKIIIKDSGKEVNRKTFYHEVGHNVWGKLDGKQKEEWEQLHNEDENHVSVYASVNAYEDFAESFSCYSTQFEDCFERLSQRKKDFLSLIIK